MNGLDDLVRALFDYAGQYPPASLSLDEALAKSAGFRKTLRRPGMAAADLVCGLAQLAELDAVRLARAGWDSKRPFRVCVLGPQLAGPGAPLPEEVEKAAAKAVAFGGPARSGAPELSAVSYEVKCPAPFLDRRAREALEAARHGLGGYPGGLFVEPECAATEWPSALEGILRFFSELPEEERPGLKLRCSGPAAIDPESLSRVVAGAVDRGLRLKATAGLHHPIVEERYGNRVGFLGLALSVRLRRTLGAGFSLPAILGCLTAAEARSFSFADGAAWLSFRLPPDRLAARSGFAIGSCSLHEPDDDLERLFPRKTLA